MKQTTLQVPAVQDSGHGVLLMNVAGSLGAILLLILLLVKLARRFGFFSPRQSGQPLLKIRAGCSLGGRERLVVVEAGKHWLVLGVSPGRITHLHTLPVAGDGSDTPVPAELPKLFARWCNPRENE